MTIEIEGKVMRRTDRALLLVVEDSGEEVWLPLSQIVYDHAVDAARAK